MARVSYTPPPPRRSGRYYGRAGRRIMRHRRVAAGTHAKHIASVIIDGACRTAQVALLVGDTLMTQLQSLFNYMMRTGDAARFNTFIRRWLCVIPQRKEIM